MKKIISMLLVCFLLFGCLPQYVSAAEMADSKTIVMESLTSEEAANAWSNASNTIAQAQPNAVAEDECIQSTDVHSMPSFDASTVYEVEPNNSMSTADQLNNEDIATGSLSGIDLDYFRFYLNSTSEVIIVATSTRSSLMYGIWDANDECVSVGLPIEYKNGYYHYLLTTPLPAGTYYVCLLDSEQLSNTYAFSVVWEAKTTHKHNYIPFDTQDPTCTDSGMIVKACSCGAETTEITDPLGHSMGLWEITLDATCVDAGVKTSVCQRTNCSYEETETIPATGIHSYTNEQDINCDVCGYERQIQADPDDKDEPTDPTEPTDKDEPTEPTEPTDKDEPTEPTEPTDKDEPVKVKTVPVYRLYNPYTQEHLLTGGAEERDALISVGWSLDGIAWEAPVEGISVYRLYNPYDDWHTYTTSESERDTMVTAGWTVDGVVSFGYTGKDGRSIYRLFNPYVQTNFHLFTAGVEERDMLVNAGWILEGIAWYAAP